VSAESERLDGLLSSVVEEGSFDVPKTQALGWVNARHGLMCARTKCFRKKLSVGPTVANQQGYPVPAEVIEIREVLVQSSASTGGLGVPYGAARHTDLAQGALHYLWLGGLYLAVGGGIFVRDENASGEELLALFPTPTEAGLTITVQAVCRPAPLVIGVGGLRTPVEFDDALVAGAIATGLARVESRADLAAPNETVFANACTELLGQVDKRFRGSGPAQIRVQGLNA
jgi:hypothetical protein